MFGACAETSVEPEYAAPRPGDVRNSCGDVGKVEMVLGIQAEDSIGRGDKTFASRFGCEGRP